MTRTSTRRRYLAAGVVAGLTAVAGCSNPIGDRGSGRPEENASNETGDEPVENVDYENPEGELRLVRPEDGARVENPVTFAMEVENFELQPTEDDQNDDDEESGTAETGAGHLHVLVDQGCVDPGYVIPEEDGYYHLSDGGSETELELEPGEHEICAQAGDDQHNAYEMTDEITIEVVGGSGGAGNETDGSGGNQTNESDGNGTADNES